MALTSAAKAAIQNALYGAARSRTLTKDHTLPAAAAAFASLIARQTFSAFSGISMWRTPSGFSASHTAFDRADVRAEREGKIRRLEEMRGIEPGFDSRRQVARHIRCADDFAERY